MFFSCLPRKQTYVQRHGPKTICFEQEDPSKTKRKQEPKENSISSRATGFRNENLYAQVIHHTLLTHCYWIWHRDAMVWHVCCVRCRCAAHLHDVACVSQDALSSSYWISFVNGIFQLLEVVKALSFSTDLGSVWGVSRDCFRIIFDDFRRISKNCKFNNQKLINQRYQYIEIALKLR